MIRKLKALSLALTAVFAMSAVVVSAAQAESQSTLTTIPSGTTVILTGTQENGLHKFVLTDHPLPNTEPVQYATTECAKATFKGVGTVADGAQTATFEPIYTECKSFGLNSTVTTNGCHYEANLGTKTGTTAAVSIQLKCPVGKKITIVAATCEVVVEAQGPLTKNTLTNAGTSTAMDLTLDTEVSGIKYTVTKDGIGCPLSGVGAYSKGDYTGQTTITAVHSVSLLPAGITVH
jgi:hypothetical protein